MKRKKNRIERSGNNFQKLKETQEQLDGERKVFTHSTGSSQKWEVERRNFNAMGCWLVVDAVSEADAIAKAKAQMPKVRNGNYYAKPFYFIER